jgi:catechol 2,3-dioxygenase-like lactoylglutathione lyase family enzyme
MPISHLYHVAIKSNDLDLSIRFYEEVLGFVRVPRPDFKHRGAWLAVQGKDPIIHLYEAGPGVADGLATPLGSAAVDHVSIFATGFQDFIARFRGAGLDWREFDVASAALYQLFVYDPSGVMLELTFDAKVETGPAPDMRPGRGWRADENFFSGVVLADKAPA